MTWYQGSFSEGAAVSVVPRWYIVRGLGDMVEENPLVVRLRLACVLFPGGTL